MVGFIIEGLALITLFFLLSGLGFSLVTMPPDRGVSHRKRSTRQTMYKRAKLRESPGFVDVKRTLRCALLNVDGLGSDTFEDVVNTVERKTPDVCILLETKRRIEDGNRDISIDGYELHEVNRSDLANDREGGGIAVYTKQSEGLLFEPHCPDIDDASSSFVAKERFWVTVKSVHSKTAICGLYLGCQYPDDRYGLWNEQIYLVVQIEAAVLRAQGYRVVFLGDFNGHIGDGREGVAGNKPGINQNGRRFLNFLDSTESCHVNGLCRTPGQWSTRVAVGLWTRQRNGVSSVIDYAGISREHAHTVVSLVIDDSGSFGTSSDHNWLFLELADHFVKKRRLLHRQVPKPKWNIGDDQNWDGYKGVCWQSCHWLIRVMLNL